jgi:hypothetical protein
LVVRKKEQRKKFDSEILEGYPNRDRGNGLLLPIRYVSQQTQPIRFLANIPYVCPQTNDEHKEGLHSAIGYH